MDKLKISAKLFNEIMSMAKKVYDREIDEGYARTVHLRTAGGKLYASVNASHRACLITDDYLEVDNEGEMVIHITEKLDKGSKWCEIVRYDGDITLITNTGHRRLDESTVPYWNLCDFLPEGTCMSYTFDASNFRRALAPHKKQITLELRDYSGVLTVRNGNKLSLILPSDN